MFNDIIITITRRAPSFIFAQGPKILKAGPVYDLYLYFLLDIWAI